MFFLFLKSCFLISLRNIAFGLWTGKETFDSRVIPLSKTWLQLIPEIHIYTDSISNSSLAKVTSHINANIHQIPIMSHFLITLYLMPPPKYKKITRLKGNQSLSCHVIGIYLRCVFCYGRSLTNERIGTTSTIPISNHHHLKNLLFVFLHHPTALIYPHRNS